MAEYRTEREARLDFALECVKLAGIKEGSAEHAALMESYNMIEPLPRGYKMTLKDAWCAAFVSAIGVKRSLLEIEYKYRQSTGCGNLWVELSKRACGGVSRVGK